MIKHNKKTGFTIIEVSLFLALSGFLMVGLILGANLSISRQRYNDTTNSFFDYLSGMYTDVLNVSNDKGLSEKPGRSKTAVYGKLVTFGEDDGTNNPDNIVKDVYTYDIVGKAISSSSATSSSIISLLKNEIDANIIEATLPASGGSTYTNTFYRMVKYTIPWDGHLQITNNASDNTVNHNTFRGAVMIVRSPTTGGIRTYVYEGPEIPSFHRAAKNEELGINGLGSSQRPLFKAFLDKLHEGQLDMCLDSPDNNLGNRQNVRIINHANNSSGVMLASFDIIYNASTAPNGSRCTGR